MDKKIQLCIMKNEKEGYIPAVAEDIVLSLSWQGMPGKLQFKILQEDMEVEEGYCVQLRYGDRDLFFGYVFSKSIDKNGLMEITAYDQLRYLKNKDVYQFAGVKASDVLRRIADDFNLKLGEVEDTGYIIPKMRSSNETLFDTIGRALAYTYQYSQNETGEYKKKSYILYDDFGKLCLKEVGSLDVNILIDRETAENYELTSSIDRGTYNKIKLYEDNKETGKREIYIAENSANQKRWGILQKTESINSKKCLDPEGKAKVMLDTVNFPKRTLRIRNALGDVRVKAGSRIWVNLPMLQNNEAVQMLVTAVDHKFGDNVYLMDLWLEGKVLHE